MQTANLWALLLFLTLVGHPGNSATAQTNDPKASFEQVFSEWKDMLKDLRDLQHRFQIAEEDQLQAIREQFLSKVEETRVMIARLRETGLAAFEQSPNADRELTRFLIKLAQDDVEHDRYESAFEIGKTLLDNGCDEKVLYDIAGTAAYGSHHFDLAEEYLTEAEMLGVLKSGAKFLPNISQVKAHWEVEQKIREEEADDNLPRVKLQTTEGDIVVELFQNEAPDTVGNFIYLVEKGYYDGLTFHRVLPGFVAQGGCNKGDGTGGPGYTIYCECVEDGYRRHFSGSLSMAKAPARNTGGSQFFLTFVPTSFLDGVHTVFGRVVEGMDVLTNLQRRDPEDADQLTIVPDRIIKAEVLRKWPDHEYLPNKVENP